MVCATFPLCDHDRPPRGLRPRIGDDGRERHSLTSTTEVFPGGLNWAPACRCSVDLRAADPTCRSEPDRARLVHSAPSGLDELSRVCLTTVALGKSGFLTPTVVHDERKPRGLVAAAAKSLGGPAPLLLHGAWTTYAVYSGRLAATTGRTSHRLRGRGTSCRTLSPRIPNWVRQSAANARTSL